METTLDKWLHIGRDKVEKIISSEPASEILRNKDRTKRAMRESADSWVKYMGPGDYLDVCVTICRLVEEAGGEEDVSEFVARNTDTLLGYLGTGGYKEVVNKAITKHTYHVGSKGYHKPIVGLQMARALVDAIKAPPKDVYDEILPGEAKKHLLSEFEKLRSHVRRSCNSGEYERAGELIDNWRSKYE